MSKLVKIPGMVDPHTHMRDLDWSHKATFGTETAAAVAGGYWAVFDMPNTPPNTIDRAALDTKLASISQQAVCDWGVYAGASQADNTAEYAAMAADTCGLKIFNNATTGNLLISDQGMRAKHYAAWPGTRLIAVHAEGETVCDILELVREYGKRTHFLHISTAEEIDYLRDAKAEGLPVTLGVCPHHLFLNEDDEKQLGPYGRMKPGLKTANDVAALWQAIADGLVDIVESDHAPHTITEKESDTPPYGVPGLETTLPLMLTAAHEGRLSLERVVELVAEAPRRIWGLTCPPETYALVDLEATYTIARNTLIGASGWSPFEGMTVHGKVIETWIRGKQVYDGEQVTIEPGFGRNLFGDAS
ncbi:dihydroorotase family protein [Phototrophicus methaneseepsis]|uniref:Dihydroorotase family protein n=1 Tax=Phototrophicus methaneseepsis TaxID=2710758 RepID=A0A7S8E6S1_9CHLR|nr:dihydroorotase family protein [Phototrophicus methaneseepsis]QPC81392.1 dihydroorotase family protein [Phototrophicus methaneseepsis]